MDGCCCSVTKLCSSLCNHVKCSMPGFPAVHYLPIIDSVKGRNFVSSALLFANYNRTLDTFVTKLALYLDL